MFCSCCNSVAHGLILAVEEVMHGFTKKKSDAWIHTQIF